MNAPLGRRGLVGLAVGAAAAAGFSLLTFIIYRAVSRRRRRRLAGGEAGEQARRPAELRPLEAADGAALLRDVLDAQEGEAQAQALAAVEAVVQGLSPQHRLELRNQLDQVLSCVSSLRSEVAELRGGLQDIALQIIQDVKKGVEDSQRLRRRRHVLHRDRTDSTSSSSIYFTASQGATSACDETSEGGYSTAYAESDYTDRETDREDGGQENQQESDEDEDEDKSCATVITLRLGEEEEEERGLDEEEEEEEEEPGHEEAQQQQLSPGPSGELALLLAQSDVLHTGDASLKAEGYRLLLDNKEEYGESRQFLWRLARAYRDMYECAEGEQEKVMYGRLGREEAEKALAKSGLNAECHKWFAVVTGLTTQHESLTGKMKSTKILKEHLDRAMALQDGDPVLFYLLGRWCYVVATLDWLEKMSATAVYQNPPTATLHDALHNFHKAEELNPGFSKKLRLYIAKCYKELNNQYESCHWSELALRMSTNTEDDEETVELLSELQSSEKKL